MGHFNVFICFGIFFLILPSQILTVSYCYYYNTYWNGFSSWGHWSQWSPCDVTCGAGQRVRTESEYCYNSYSNQFYTSNTRQDVSKCSGACLNHGTFSNDKCICTAGFKGNCCEVAYVCSPKCANRGKCIADDICDCETGFYGKRCEIGSDFDKTLIPQLHTFRPVDELNTPLSWYDVPKYDKGNKACFLKVQVENAYFDTVLFAESSTSNGTSESYGNYSTAPIDSSASFNGSSRFACLQVRCPRTTDNGEEYDVAVIVSVQSKYRNCHAQNTSRFPNINISTTQNGSDSFTVVLENGNNYGPAYGVYMNKGYRETAMYLAEQGCYSGRYYDNNHFVPSVGALAKYTCL